MTLDELTNLRHDLGLTQTQMADELGLKLRAYQEIEAGKAALRKMHILAAERVALAYGARGKLDDESTTYMLGAEWFERLIENAKAFTDPMSD